MNWNALLGVYASVRRVGHTSAAAFAAQRCNGIVLCANKRDADEIMRTTNAETASAQLPDHLRGRQRALIPDNHLMMVMLSELARLQDRTERDEQALEKLDRLLTDEVRIGEALRRMVQDYESAEDSARLNGALFALAAIGTAVAFGRAMELLDFAQFPSNVTLPFARKIDALLRAVGLEDVIP